jgi:hypothetical protein
VGYRFDYLVAALPCGSGGEVSPADSSTEMTTRLRDDPQLAYLGVGDGLPVDTPRALRSGYLLLHEPAPGEPVVLLHQWTCPACGYAYNWAEVVVTDGVITAIQAVDLNRDAVARAHYVVDDVRDVAADLAGVRSPLALSDDRVVRILRAKLPERGGWRLLPGD